MSNKNEAENGLTFIVQDGALIGNANSKWDMVCTVTIEAGGKLVTSRPASSSAGYVHVKDTLTLAGDKESGKYAIVACGRGSYNCINFATLGSSKIVANYADVNWCAVCESTDSYYNRMKDAIAYHLSAVSANFNLDYALNQPNTMMGHMTESDGIGLLRNWAYDNHLTGVLVEGFNGFPYDSRYMGKVYKANEEIIVNWLITAMNYLGK
jgi:hypothetical protein